LQYVRYLQKKRPGHDFVFHHVAQKIKKLECDEAAFQAVSLR